MSSTVEPYEFESAQARMGNPLERQRNPEDEVCPICKGIKGWDSSECEDCENKKEVIHD